jgi:uncharacterized protein YciI
MPYYVVNATHRDPLPMTAEEVSACLPDHQAHIARGIEDNLVLCAGPKAAGKGGFVIIKADSRAALDRFIAEDPFCVKGIMDYEITEFIPADRQSYLAPWL